MTPESVWTDMVAQALACQEDLLRARSSGAGLAQHFRVAWARRGYEPVTATDAEIRDSAELCWRSAMSLVIDRPGTRATVERAARLFDQSPVEVARLAVIHWVESFQRSRPNDLCVAVFLSTESPEFRDLTPDQIRSAFRGNTRGVPGIAARLSVSVGAFGDTDVEKATAAFRRARGKIRGEGSTAKL